MRNEFLKEVLYKLSLRMVRFNNLTIRVTSMRGLNMNFIKFCFVIQAVDIDTYGEHYWNTETYVPIDQNLEKPFK